MFDYASARKDGYSDAEIQKATGVNIAQIRADGYGDAEIAEAFKSYKKEQPTEAPQPPKVTKKTSGNLLADTDFSQKPKFVLPDDISDDTTATKLTSKPAQRAKYVSLGQESPAYTAAKAKSLTGSVSEQSVKEEEARLSRGEKLELDDEGKPVSAGLETPWVMPGMVGVGATKAISGALLKDAGKVAYGKGFIAGEVGGGTLAWGAHETVDKSLTDEFKKAHPTLSEVMKVSAALVGGVAGGMAAERRYMQQYQSLIDDVKEGAVPPQQAEEVLRQDAVVQDIINKVETTRVQSAEERAAQDEAIASGINKELYPEQPKQVDEVAQKPKEVTPVQQVEQQPLSPLMEKVNTKLQEMGHEPLIKPMPIQAQRIKEAQEIPVGGSEDAAKAQVAQLFKPMPDAQYKKMSAADRQAYDEEYQRALQYGQVDEAGEALDDFGQPLFSKGEESVTIKEDILIGDEPKGYIQTTKRGNQINIDDIEMMVSKTGKGTEAIKNVMKQAEASGDIVTLTSDAMRGKRGQALNRTLYEKLGFVKNSGKNKDKSITEEYYYKPAKSVFKSQSDSIDGTTTQSVRTIARKFLGKQYNKLKDDLNIVQTFDDLPEDLRKRTGLQTVEVGGKPRGIYDPVTGKAHLIADSMTDKEVQSVIAHELLHRHIQSGRQVLGSDYDTFVLRLKQLKDDKLVKEAMDAVRSAGTPVKHMNEETMAYLVEKYQYAKDISPKLKRFISGIVERVKVFIAETAVKLGVKPEWLISKMSADEIAQVLKSAAMKSGNSASKEADVLKSGGGGSWTKRLMEWHKDSHPLTKNEDGTPKVFYHGTSADFEKFRTHQGAGGELGAGAYFTDSPKTASIYAESASEIRGGHQNIVPVYIKMKNPLDASDMEYIPSRKKLIKQGYDGIIDKNAGGGAQYVAFYPQQIKSIHNRGTFSEADPNILFSKAKQTIADVKQSSQPENVQAVVEKAIKKNIVEKTLDKSIQKIVEGAIKIADVATARKISGTVNKLIETDFVKNLIGHKIYQETEYLKLREDTLISINRIKDHAMKLHNQLSGLSKEAKEAMHDYMTGYKGEVNLTPELKKLADNITKSIDDAGQKLVDEGVLSKEAYESWKGQYLHRSYTSKMEKAKSIISGRGFTVEGIKQRGKTWEGTTDELYELEKSGVIGKVSEGLIEAETLPNGKVKFRRDWTREERTKMGEVRDAAYTVPETMARLAVLAENSKLLKNIPSHLLLEQGKRTTDEMEELGYTLMRGDRYGALNGKWVSNTVADDIQRLGNDLHGDKVMKAYKEYVRALKASYTVYDTVAHTNNTISNVIMQFTAGLNPIKAIVYAGQAVKGLKKINRLAELESKRLSGFTAKEAEEVATIEADKTVQLLQEAQELGLFGRSGLADILKAYLEPALNVADTTLSKIQRAFGAVYEAEDNIMRFSAYKQLKEQGMNPKEAVHTVSKEIVPDYTNPISKYARSVRDWGWVPFMSWIYHSTPIIIKHMKKNPTRSLSLIGGIAAIDAAFGINPFDEEDIPQEGFAHQNIVTGREGDKVDVMRIQSMIPHAQMIDPFETYVRGTVTGGIPQMLMGIVGNHNFYFNKPITRKEGAEGAYQMGKKIVMDALPTPGIFDKAYNLAESHIRDKEKRRYDPVIQPKTPAQEAASFFVNVKTYDKAKQRQHAEKERLK